MPRQARKIYFYIRSFYLQGIINDSNEQDTSFLDCKHKHMMKSGAPPDKVGVLHRLLLIEFHFFSQELISTGYHSLVPGLISILLETVCVPLRKSTGSLK